jgi:hypothetical protein
MSIGQHIADAMKNVGGVVGASPIVNAIPNGPFYVGEQVAAIPNGEYYGLYKIYMELSRNVRTASENRPGSTSALILIAY